MFQVWYSRSWLQDTADGPTGTGGSPGSERGGRDEQLAFWRGQAPRHVPRRPGRRDRASLFTSVGRRVRVRAGTAALGDARGSGPPLGTPRAVPAGNGRPGRAVVPGADARRALQLGAERARRGGPGHATARP